MDLALPLQTVLAMSKGKYAQQTVSLSHGNGRVYATTNMAAGSTTLLHYHEESHLSFILNGGIIDRRKTSETEKLSGDLMFFRAGEPHQSLYKIFPSIHLNLEFSPSYLKENAVTEALLSSNVANNPNTKFILLKIYKEILVKDDLTGDAVEMLLLNLIASARSEKNTRPKWIDRVSELLNDKWADPLSLKDMAKAVNVHPITISKHFSTYFACTLGEHRRRIKVEKALRLIKTSALPLTDIAYKCGFFDQSHFTRTFKQMTGFLPNHYRSL